MQNFVAQDTKKASDCCSSLCSLNWESCLGIRPFRTNDAHALASLAKCCWISGWKGTTFLIMNFPMSLKIKTGA